MDVVAPVGPIEGGHVSAIRSHLGEVVFYYYFYITLVIHLIIRPLYLAGGGIPPSSLVISAR